MMDTAALPAQEGVADEVLLHFGVVGADRLVGVEGVAGALGLGALVAQRHHAELAWLSPDASSRSSSAPIAAVVLVPSATSTTRISPAWSAAARATASEGSPGQRLAIAWLPGGLRCCSRSR